MPDEGLQVSPESHLHSHSLRATMDTPAAPRPTPHAPEQQPHRHPVSAIRARHGHAERVASAELAHAGHELRQPADKERHARRHVRRRDAAHLRVNQREEQRRRREGDEAEGRRVGERGAGCRQLSAGAWSAEEVQSEREGEGG